MEKTVLSANKDGDYSLGFKILAVLVAAFSTGFMWRARGDGGWGSMWGMFGVAVVLSLLVYFVFSHRKKADYNFLFVSVMGMAITVGGWGTLNKQISGVLNVRAEIGGELVPSIVNVKPVSGLIIMLLLGFCWIPFFSFLMGRFFSARQYKLKDFVLAVAVYYAVSYLFKATLAHPLFMLLSPEAVNLFKDGLAGQGMSTNTWLVYLQHFDSDPWAKTFAGGRNYFTSVEIIATAFGSLGVWIYQRFALKDKIGGRVNLSVSCIMAFAITVADVFLIPTVKEGIWGHWNVPAWIEQYAWSYWEYFTGFLLGMGLMILFFAVDKKTAAHRDVADVLPKLPQKLGFVYHTAATFGFTLFFTLIRPFADRVVRIEYTFSGKRVFYSLDAYNEALAGGTDPATMFLYEGTVPENMTLYIALGFVGAVIAALIVGRNMILKKRSTPVNMRFGDFCAVAFLLYFAAVVSIYFLTAGMAVIRPGFSLITLVMQISTVVIYVGFGLMLYLKYNQGLRTVAE
ncbi:MAG: hypothetical protein LBS36_13375 [Oscillospiraceae bacterium]|jgi:hypothetical protein|nr:hypothetical protein [Oscillospiraceae bacterium]